MDDRKWSIRSESGGVRVSGTSAHRVIAYRVVTSVTLKLKDFSKVGLLTEQLANIEETQDQSLSYTLEEIEQARARPLMTR
jgi:uncharacterized protein YggE